MIIKILISFTLISIFSLYLQAGAVRIMPVGDSITYDDSYADANNPRPVNIRHAYRNYLWYRLKDAKYWVDFVGSRVAGDAIVPSFDPNNEAYPGETTDSIGSTIYNKLVQNPADIILLHIGTNDRWRIDKTGNYMSGMSKIFNEVNRYEANYHHHIKIILALIIGRRNNDFASFTDTFNTNLKNLANSRIAQGDDIVIVDMQHHSGLNYSTDFRDPAHPTNTGYDKMATLWYSTLKQFLPPPPPPSPPSQPSELLASEITDNSITLQWVDNAQNETGYIIYQNDVLIAKLAANNTHYSINNLTPNTSYTYKIVAYNANGNSNAATITLKTEKSSYAWLVPVYHMTLY